MSYIHLINAAWELREQGIISAHEHDLYNYLLHRCNRLNWKNPFNQSTEVVCAVLGINRNALTNRRNRLLQAGLITFKEGVAKGRPAEYTINGIENDTLGDTLTNTLTEAVAVTLIPALPYTINKDKKRHDQTRQKEKPAGTCSFSKPLVKEVIDYCRQRRNSIDACAFYDFYESKGWMIGRNKMRDWRAAVRTWEKKTDAELNHGSAKHDNSRRYEEF
ncbi:hypothetical protein [Prevotella sp. 10(H)]|uniref:hypothetical protein n=1 Tax=Prevotella sp. 10(H) TaxID=1158294 RepID=UPI0004A7529F|nr:hypothetical protein [Prevotella sp. 10(H)]